MTLAGTRPPTVDEWEKYELHHRARLAAKPGLTGMWQVSGRSNITDFEEVVELDREYISHDFELYHFYLFLPNTYLFQFPNLFSFQFLFFNPNIHYISFLILEIKPIR